MTEQVHGMQATIVSTSVQICHGQIMVMLGPSVPGTEATATQIVRVVNVSFLPISHIKPQILGSGREDVNLGPGIQTHPERIPVPHPSKVPGARVHGWRDGNSS